MKIVMFVQWSDLEYRVAAALRSHDVDLHTARDRSVICAVHEFQRSTERSPVLLISLDQMDEILSIPADHIFLLHPMINNAEKEVMELVRPVHPGREIHVHRFVTLGTVEEILHDQQATEFMVPSIVQPQAAEMSCN